jgi:hypothetical protein
LCPARDETGIWVRLPAVDGEMTVPQRGGESTQDDGGTKEQLRLQARKTGTADGRSGLMGSMTAQRRRAVALAKKGRCGDPTLARCRIRAWTLRHK